MIRQLFLKNRPIVLPLFSLFLHAGDLWRNIHVFQYGAQAKPKFLEYFSFHISIHNCTRILLFFPQIFGQSMHLCCSCLSRGGTRGGLGGATAPLLEASSPPHRRRFLVLVGGNLAKLRTKTPFYSHCSPPVGSSSPSVGKFLAPPLCVSRDHDQFR